MHILVAGSRSWTDYAEMVKTIDNIIEKEQLPFADDVVIVSGGAKGADSLAERYANEKGYELLVIRAEWDKYGKSAGYRRNEEMHKVVATDVNRYCVCFWDGQSKGTAHNFELAKEYKTPLCVIKKEIDW